MSEDGTRSGEGNTAPSFEAPGRRRSRCRSQVGSRSALAVGSLLLAGCVLSAEPAFLDPPAIREACSQVPCRPTEFSYSNHPEYRLIRIPVSGGPYVYRGRINLLAGEEFRILPILVHGEIDDLRYLEDQRSPRNAFSASFFEDADHSWLSFHNPFDRTVMFHMSRAYWHSLLVGDDVYCFVPPRQTLLHSWPPETEGVAIYEVSFVPALAWLPDQCS